MMMIGIGLVGYEESRPLKAAIGKLARCRDDGFAVTLARRRVCRHRDRPEIRGIMTIGIGPVGYAGGWGLTDGMDVVFSWEGD
jgi:hypothetical protein